jgi:hypothetical protein
VRPEFRVGAVASKAGTFSIAQPAIADDFLRRFDAGAENAADLAVFGADRAVRE